MKYYSSVRLDIRRVEAIKGKGNEIIGNHVRVKTVKNKVAPPFRTAEFNIIFGKGISRDDELVDAAVSMDLITKSGAWFYYTLDGHDERWQGKERVKETLAINKELAAEIEAKVMARLRGMANDEEPPVDEDEDDIEEMQDI